MLKQNQKLVLFVRNFIFGAEDSLVSTVGLLSGIAVGGVARSQIILTGVVLIFVEAISMAAGSFLSEYSAEEYEQNKKANMTGPVLGGFVMFISYILSGLIPLLPYALIGGKNALLISIIVSLVALFILGFISAKILRTSIIKTGIRMLLVGGVAIIVGIVVASQIT